MDWTVYPDTPTSRLPRPLRFPALLVRNLILPIQRKLQAAPATPALDRPWDYVYEADGLATVYFSPFQHDDEWSAAYEEMVSRWYGSDFDNRWRMWILTTAAKQVKNLTGSMAEFGVYRAGCARMILGTVGIAPEAKYHLFDTFAGIPDTGLTDREKEEGYAGRLQDTSVEYVRQLLAPWSDRLVFHAGDVFDTLEEAETGQLSLVHMDLNASEPTRVAVEYTYPRLVPGGIIVFDDYGWGSDYEQRDVIHEVCDPLPETIVALPSGQALLTKLP